MLEFNTKTLEKITEYTSKIGTEIISRTGDVVPVAVDSLSQKEALTLIATIIGPAGLAGIIVAVFGYLVAKYKKKKVEEKPLNEKIINRLIDVLENNLDNENHHPQRNTPVHRKKRKRKKTNR